MFKVSVYLNRPFSFVGKLTQTGKARKSPLIDHYQVMKHANHKLVPFLNLIFCWVYHIRVLVE